METSHAGEVSSSGVLCVAPAFGWGVEIGVDGWVGRVDGLGRVVALTVAKIEVVVGEKWMVVVAVAVVVTVVVVVHFPHHKLLLLLLLLLLVMVEGRIEGVGKNT